MAEPTSGKQTDIPAVRALVVEGTKLHDRGEFDAAIDKYREALKLDSDNVQVMYEMAYSQYAKRDLKESLKTASKAVEYSSALRPALFILIGNIHDDLKEPRRAIESYEAALRENPNLGLGHYNLGVTRYRLGELEKARMSFQNALALEHQRPSTHYLLGRSYMEEGYRVPAILALSRFLLLEPTSARSETALGWIDAIFRAGVKTDAKGNTEITMDPKPKLNEGDFSSAELLVLLLQASEKLTPEPGAQPEGPFEVKRLKNLFEGIAEMKSETKGQGFAERYYVPYFVGLKEQGLLEPFTYYILQSSKSSFRDWVAINKSSVQKMLDWSSHFSWVRAAPIGNKS